MKLGKKLTRALTFAVTLAVLATMTVPLPSSAALNSNDRGADKLWMAIKQLTGVSSIMDTGAHPDDERNSLLAYCLLEKGAETIVVSTTRGAGGQNAIGKETGLAYSALRTRELQEATEMIGSELVVLCEEYDNTAIDFGFSKLGEESYKIWDVDKITERLVRAIRTYRPDVVFNSANNVLSQHGQHQATNLITADAFKKAADPKEYPEQITKEGLQPYQAKKLYDVGDAKDYTAKMDYSGFNPVLGITYEQLGQNSRYMHISQSMGKEVATDAAAVSYHTLISSTLPKPADKEEDMFDGIAMTFTDLAASYNNEKPVYRMLNKLQADVDSIVAAYPDFEKVTSEVHDMIEDVNEGLSIIEKSKLSKNDKYDLTFRLNKKLEQLYETSAQSSLLVVDVTPASYEVAKGQSTKVTVKLYNGGKSSIKDIKVNLNTPNGWTVSSPKISSASSIAHNKSINLEYTVTVPKNAEYFHPYEENPLSATISYSVDGVQSKLTQESEKLFAVMPEYSLQLTPENYVLNTTVAGNKIPVTVGVKSYVTGNTSTVVTLDVPSGWNIEPKQVSLSFTGSNQNKTANFTVTPPANLKEERFVLKAKATSKNMVSDQTVQVIEYDHIGRTYYLYDAALTVQAANVILPENLKVGYFDSGKDEVYKYLEQIGMDVTVITEDDVMYSDLSRFDTIVLGIRAYRDSDQLLTANNRLLEFAKNGGNLVVNYSQNGKSDRWDPSLAPYPLTIGPVTLEWRVVEEDAKVTILDPNNQVFNTPNKIVDSDWDGWVQERSIYNISEADPRYTKLISSYDTGLQDKPQDGQWLTTNYGKGIYTYTSVVWYRQIQQAMNPGAYRLFVNMLSMKQ